MNIQSEVAYKLQKKRITDDMFKGMKDNINPGMTLGLFKVLLNICTLNLLIELILGVVDGEKNWCPLKVVKQF